MPDRIGFLNLVEQAIKPLDREARARVKGRRHSAKRFAAKETNHNKLNENLGLPDEPPTKALFEIVVEALKK